MSEPIKLDAPLIAAQLINCAYTKVLINLQAGKSTAKAEVLEEVIKDWRDLTEILETATRAGQP